MSEITQKNNSVNDTSNSYSEKLFSDLVFVTLKIHPFDSKLKLDLITKGKKLQISEARIHSIINANLSRIFKEKKVVKKNPSNDNKIDNKSINNPQYSIPLQQLQNNTNPSLKLNKIAITALSIFALCLLFIINLNFQAHQSSYIDPFKAADSKTEDNNNVASHSSENIKLLEENTISAGTTSKEDALNTIIAKNQSKVRFETQLGNIDVLVHPEWDEVASMRFIEIVSDGFYNNSPWFRVVPDFVIQTGFSSNQKLQDIWGNNTFLDSTQQMSNKQWTIAFGKTYAPNSRSTHIFINLVDNSTSLDTEGYSPFAEVVGGRDVVTKIVARSKAGPHEEFTVDQSKMQTEGVDFVKTNPFFKDRIVWIKKAYILK